MNTNIRNKLNYLYNNLFEENQIVTMNLLKRKGYSYDLIQGYLRNGWLSSIGSGAYIKPNSKIDIFSGIRTIQKQLGLNIHIGGITSLGLQGYLQYLSLNSDKIIYVYTDSLTRIPTWFINYSWDEKIIIKQSNLFSSKDIDLIEFDEKRNGEIVKISSVVRACLEVLTLVPHKFSFTYVDEIFESLITLHPKDVTVLLESCQSIKAKRLFLYFVKKYSYRWAKEINFENINIGSGKRLIVKNGILDKDYLITIPKEREYDTIQSIL